MGCCTPTAASSLLLRVRTPKLGQGRLVQLSINARGRGAAMQEARTFWIVWGVALAAVIVGRFIDWLNVGAMAGAIGLLVAIAATYPRR